MTTYCPMMLRMQRGQAAAEYLVVTLLLVGVAGSSWFGKDLGVLGLVLDALRSFHHRFAASLAMPL